MFRRIAFRSAVCAVISMLTAAGVGSAISGPVFANTFTPASVQGMQAINGSSPNEVDFLRVKASALDIEERVVAVFDIGSLGALGGNTLTVFVDYNNFNDASFPGGILNIYAFSGSTAASGQQWNSGSPIGSFTEHAGVDSLGHASWLSLDITSWLMEAAAVGDPYIGFSFRAPCCSAASSNPAAHLDQSRINITSPIPEPETYGMLLAGGIVIGFALRRRKRGYQTSPV